MLTVVNNWLVVELIALVPALLLHVEDLRQGSVCNNDKRWRSRPVQGGYKVQRKVVLKKVPSCLLGLHGIRKPGCS